MLRGGTVLAVLGALVPAVAGSSLNARAQDDPGMSSRAPIGAGLPPGFDDMFEHRYDRANGVRLHYVIGGPEDGPLVVLLHGWPQTWYTWRNVMPGLVGAGFRVAAVDYRGAGASEKPVGGYDKATMAADIRALAQGLGARRLHLVGRDIGVMVAYAYAAQWPDEVATLTMLDVPVPASTAWNEAKHKPDPELWHFGLFQQRDIARDDRRRTGVPNHPGLLPVPRLPPRSRRGHRRLRGGLCGSRKPRAGFELYRAFPEDERRFAGFTATKLPMPVPALAGDRSNGEIELQMAREVASDVRGGVAPQTGHWLPDENSEFLLRQLVDFLGPRHGGSP